MDTLRTILAPIWNTDRHTNNQQVTTEVTHDQFLYFPSSTTSIKLPNLLLPPELHNNGNYIISLSKLVRWLGEHAEGLGVEIFPGFSASEVLYSEEGAVQGKPAHMDTYVY